MTDDQGRGARHATRLELEERLPAGLEVSAIDRWESDADPVTFWSITRALSRHPRLGALGVLLAVLGGVLAARCGGVYYEEATVVFIAPRLTVGGNSLQAVSGSLISVAGLVSREVDSQSGDPLAVSSNVTIVDVGIRRGSWARLPNEGGQWGTRFERAVLDVQVVGDSPESVRADMVATVSRIRTALRDGQLAAGAPGNMLIEAGVSPPSPLVEYRTGSRARALLAALVIGLGATAAAVLLADRLSGGARRPGRPHRHPAPSGGQGLPREPAQEPPAEDRADADEPARR